MKWEQALTELKAGSKVQRLAWYSSGKRISLPLAPTNPSSADTLPFRTYGKDGSFEPWQPQPEDVTADDWQTC